MNKKGFTLIELLAVIVILAVIALIATPIIMNAIGESKNGALKNSAYGYLSALEYYVAQTYNDDNQSNDINVNGTFDWTNNKDNIKSKGTQPTNVDVILENGKVKSGIITFNDKTLTIENGKVGEIIDTTTFNSSKVYGVSFNGTTGTRTNDASSFGIGKGTGGYTDTNGAIASVFDDKEIYNEIVDNYVEDGNVFVKIPKFYISKTKVGSNFTYKISKVKKDSTYYLPYSFYDEESSKVLPYVLIGKYDASLSADNKLESKTGKAPLVSKTISQFRDYVRANNLGSIKGYQLIDIHAVDILQTLFYVEFATLDSQSIMKGNTSTSAALVSGTTNSVNTASGSPTSNTTGTYAMKYRGIENFWGNLWQFVDGINIKDNKAYVATNPNYYASDTFIGAYSPMGYANATKDGNVQEMGYDASKPYIQLPTIASATNTYGDYYWQSTGNRIALLGGGWSNGSGAGASYWVLSADSGYTYLSFGSRVLKKAL